MILTDHGGYKVRPDSADHIAVDDTARVFRKPGAPSLGDSVLDLGAHIGSFTRRCLEAGATKVVAVEPEPGNADMFLVNVPHDTRVSFVRAAVVGPDAPQTASLYVSKTHAHSLERRPGKSTIEVPTVTLARLFLEADFTYVKIDIEGGEYSLDLPDALPDSVDHLFLEFHLTYGRRHDAEVLRSRLDRQGWRALWETSWNGRTYVEGVFAR
jgi:FkbM family methyltransferase